MRDTIAVTQMTMEEIESVAAMFNEYRMFYKQAQDLNGAAAFLFERMVHRESVVFVAKDAESDQYFGFTQLYPTFSSISMQRCWILNDLYVRASCRGQGIGKRLLDRARSYASLTEAKQIALATAADNFNAHNLYEKLGYVKDTDFYHYSLSLQK